MIKIKMLPENEREVMLMCENIYFFVFVIKKNIFLSQKRKRDL